MGRSTTKGRLARRENELALHADGNNFRTVEALVSEKYGVSENCPTGLDLGQKQAGRGIESTVVKSCWRSFATGLKPSF